MASELDVAAHAGDAAAADPDFALVANQLNATASSEPRRRRHQILQNQRGLLLATVLRSRTDAVICTMPFRLHE